MLRPEMPTGNSPQLVLPLTGVTSATETSPARGRFRTILEAHRDRLRDQLSRPVAMIDTGRVREMLLDLSADIRAGSSLFEPGDYGWILDRLTEIYARGLDHQPPEPFTATAAAYGQVIETLSQLYPGQDYSAAVGQLFCYMSRLFQSRKHSWKAVYKNIISIPESVEAKRLLKRSFFVEIEEWAEAGVGNLFAIRNDLYEKIGELAARIERLERRIERIASEPNQRAQAETSAYESNVIDFAQARRKQLIRLLECRRNGLIEEKEDEEAIVVFIESDIREFEEKLKATRRAYFVRPV